MSIAASPTNHSPADELKEIELLVISTLPNGAQELQTLLRDAGHNVHVKWLEKPETLADELGRALPRLICCEQGADEQDLNRLIGLCKNVARGIPAIAITPRPSTKRTEELIQLGAAQVVSLSQKHYTVWALTRELEFSSLRAQIKDDRRQIRQLEQRLGVIVAESPEALAYVHDGIHTQLNQAYARLFGFEEPGELENVPLMDLVAPQSRDDIKALLATSLKQPEHTEHSAPFVAQRADDSNVALQIRCRKASLAGEEQIEVQVINAVKAPLAATAPRNAFAGRAALYEALADVQSLRMQEHSVGLLFVYIDDLEALQDRLGLPAVDHILNEVSFFLLEHLEGEDRSFRFDVGQFAVLCSGDSPPKIEQSAEALRAAIDAEIFGDAQGSSALGASIAVAHLDNKNNNVDHLLRTMRLAHKTSRRAGNTVVIATTGDSQLPSQEADRLWLTRIKANLDQNRFTLAYQSIASLDGTPGELHDVYVRMLGDKGEELRPAEFFPIAQRHGLMPALDQWVARRVLEVADDNAVIDKNSLLFIKLSQATIESDDIFLPWLEKELGQRQTDSSRFVIAFDEESLQANIKQSTMVANALQKMGLKLAIHNFSASAQALKLMDLLDVKFVKLNPELTSAIASTEQDPRMAAAIKTAQARNIKIIAAQVQDANSMARLWEAGVNYVQGYFVQEPSSSVRSSKVSTV